MNKLYKKKQHCISCHFLSQTPTGLGPKIGHEIAKEYRQRFQKDDFAWVGVYKIGCFFDIWDDNCVLDKELGRNNRRKKQLMEIERNDCFYLEHRPGISFRGAERIQRKHEDYQESSRDRKFTISGLFIAAIALAASTIVGIANLIVSCSKPSP